MIIKRQPKELDGKPFISENDPHNGNSEIYMGRVIVEFWREDTAFAWSVDDPDQPSEEWLKLFLNGLNRATQHIEYLYRSRQKDITSPDE